MMYQAYQYFSHEIWIATSPIGGSLTDRLTEFRSFKCSTVLVHHTHLVLQVSRIMTDSMYLPSIATVQHYFYEDNNTELGLFGSALHQHALTTAALSQAHILSKYELLKCCRPFVCVCVALLSVCCITASLL